MSKCLLINTPVVRIQPPRPNQPRKPYTAAGVGVLITQCKFQPERLHLYLGLWKQYCHSMIVPLAHCALYSLEWMKQMDAMATCQKLTELRRKASLSRRWDKRLQRLAAEYTTTIRSFASDAKRRSPSGETTASAPTKIRSVLKLAHEEPRGGRGGTGSGRTGSRAGVVCERSAAS